MLYQRVLGLFVEPEEQEIYIDLFFAMKFTLGIRVIPPTRITSLISATLTSASLIAFLHGSKEQN